LRTTLLDLLATDLTAWMAGAADGVPRRVLLWLDPDAQFRRLVGLLRSPLELTGLRLLTLSPLDGMGQLDLKLALLRLDGVVGSRAVVYLPGFGASALMPPGDGMSPALWSVYDYRFKGCVWGQGETWRPGVLMEPPSLLSWLRGHGVTLADEDTTQRLSTGGADALLAQYAELRRDEPIANWSHPLRADDVADALGGDPRESLRRFLTAPEETLQAWGDRKRLILERASVEYGLTAPGPAASSATLDDAFLVQLALCEAWEAFDRPADFPHLSRLPAGVGQRLRCAAFLRDDLLSRRELLPRYHQRMRLLERDLPLADWAASRPGQPAGLPLLAHVHWRRFLERLNGAMVGGDWRVAAGLLLESEAEIVAGAASPWDDPEGESHWYALRDLSALLQDGTAAIAESLETTTAAALIRAYCERWWRLDHLHVRLRAACRRATGMEQVRRLTDLAYFDAVSKINARFCELVEAQPVWPPDGSTDVASIRAELWQPTGRTAVLIVDACRWDLAQSIKQRLGEGCTLTPLIATLPTETPFGMTALLPLAEMPLQVRFGEHGQVDLRQDGSANLAQRDGRKALLQSRLTGLGRNGLAFIELQDLLGADAPPRAKVVVVFDHSLDEQGHSGAEQLPELVESFVQHLRHAIERLHEAKIATVHVVTDHGFLLLPPAEVNALGRPELPIAQTYQRSRRWAALRPDVPAADLLHLPMPLAPQAVLLAFPRGVRTLEAAEEFLHGGISLQECVIPHLVSRVRVAPGRLGLDLSVAHTQLSTGTVPVTVRPLLPAGQTRLHGPPPLRLHLWIETVGLAGDPPRRVTEMTELQLRADAGEIKWPPYLETTAVLKAGQSLRLRAQDADSGREFDSITLTLLRDLG
jgi:hypothetical protein